MFQWHLTNENICSYVQVVKWRGLQNRRKIRRKRKPVVLCVYCLNVDTPLDETRCTDTWLHLEFRSLNVLYWHLYYLCLSILGILFAQHLIFDGFFCLFLSVNILIFIQIWIYIFRSILYFDILLSFTHYVIPIFFHDVTGSFYRVHSLVTWYTYTSDALLGFLCIVTVQHC